MFSVQHHHAHIAALMGECGAYEMVGIACDGYGYGPNGEAWGGEILHCNRTGFQRIGHLQEQPMVGGDLSTRYPLRMVAGILHGSRDMEEWLQSKSSQFPHGEEEVEVILKQIKTKHVLKTTSCGRVLDAVSAALGLCYERTFEGEPSMTLESAAMKGRDILNMEPRIQGDVIETTNLLNEIFEKRNMESVADLACSAQTYLAKSLAHLAIDEAEKLRVKVVGFSGGVAYNEQMTLTIKKTVEKRGLRFVSHNLVPPGDGGLSFGQVVAASLTAS
jgi:hydrogenase maturation protein HypF